MGHGPLVFIICHSLQPALRHDRTDHQACDKELSTDILIFVLVNSGYENRSDTQVATLATN